MKIKNFKKSVINSINKQIHLNKNSTMTSAALCSLPKFGWSRSDLLIKYSLCKIKSRIHGNNWFKELCDKLGEQIARSIDNSIIEDIIKNIK